MANEDVGLIGVGTGVQTPEWINELQARYQKQPEPPDAITEDAESRDQRVIKSSVSELAGQVVGYSQTVDLGSIPANTRQAVDIPITSIGKLRAGDNVLYLGAALMDDGLIPSGSLPALADDTARVYVTNVTGAAIDDGSMTHNFVFFRGV